MESDWIEVRSEAGFEHSHEDVAGRGFLKSPGPQKTPVGRAVSTIARHAVASSGNFDDVFFHRSEDGEQFVLFLLPDVEGIQRTDQVLH